MVVITWVNLLLNRRARIRAYFTPVPWPVTVKWMKNKIKIKQKKKNKRAMMALGRSPEYHWD